MPHRKVTPACVSLKVKVAVDVLDGFAGPELITGAGGGVTPERPICWLAPLAFRLLLVKVSVPVSAPAVMGVNSTPITQLFPAYRTTEVEQVVVLGSRLKSALDSSMPLRLSAVLPLF